MSGRLIEGRRRLAGQVGTCGPPSPQSWWTQDMRDREAAAPRSVKIWRGNPAKRRKQARSRRAAKEMTRSVMPGTNLARRQGTEAIAANSRCRRGRRRQLHEVVASKANPCAPRAHTKRDEPWSTLRSICVEGNRGCAYVRRTARFSMRRPGRHANCAAICAVVR